MRFNNLPYLGQQSAQTRKSRATASPHREVPTELDKQSSKVDGMRLVLLLLLLRLDCSNFIVLMASGGHILTTHIASRGELLW